MWRFQTFIYLLTFIFLFASNSFAQEEEKEETGPKKRKWFVPDHSKIHFAGGYGFLSVSAGKKILRKKRIELDITIGYLPKAIGGDDILTGGIKAQYIPWRIDWKNKPLQIEPLAVGLSIFQAWGTRFNRLNDRNLYSKGYYWWTSNRRFAPFIGQRIQRTYKNSSIKSIGVYYEIGTYDLYIYSWLPNQKTFPFHKLFNFSGGVQLSF
ncbi:hypothetical protein AAG747_10340 [Rapidithrix thailandica]|uniref:Outer membrane protein beta-barrel domain-containing protein n=1 Tax=Rapidithrix thailandica TaxID=413964 RepID=A0AAW9RTT2_9BACT